MLEPTDESLRRAGRYNPVDGFGVPDEMDWGNFSGSVLMLAMLDEGRGLRIFGEGLLEKGTAFPRSGRGPDNRRTNALEALLNYLQPFPQMTALRELLKDTWRLVILGVACSGVTNRFPSECVQQVLACDDEQLPPGEITDEELISFETVMDALGPEGQKGLRELREGEVTKATISACTGCSRNSITVNLIQQAIRRCALEDAGNHYGSLLFLFFHSARREAQLLWLRRMLEFQPDKLNGGKEYNLLTYYLSTYLLTVLTYLQYALTYLPILTYLLAYYLLYLPTTSLPTDRAVYTDLPTHPGSTFLLKYPPIYLPACLPT